MTGRNNMDTTTIGQKLESLFDATFTLEDSKEWKNRTNKRDENRKTPRSMLDAMLAEHTETLDELESNTDKRISYRVEHIRTAGSPEQIRMKLEEIGKKLGLF
jgi:hypothetical protein